MTQKEINNAFGSICTSCISLSTSHTEKRKTFQIDRVTNKVENIHKIRVDECLICGTGTIKCDFAFIREDPSEFYFVELKGEDIFHAYAQIIQTIKFFQRFIKLDKRQIEAFIVSSAVPKATHAKFNDLIIDFKKHYGRSLLRQTDIYIKRI